jgi:hypothetical protein
VDDFHCLDSKAFSTSCLTKFLNEGVIKLIPKNSGRYLIGGGIILLY